MIEKTIVGDDPKYQIGIGRRMSGPEDYRGVEIEGEGEVEQVDYRPFMPNEP